MDSFGAEKCGWLQWEGPQTLSCKVCLSSSSMGTPKHFTHTYISHIHSAVGATAMQGAALPFRSNLGLISPLKDTTD